MGCELFEIGVLHQDGRMLLRRGWRTEQVGAAGSGERMREVLTFHAATRHSCSEPDRPTSTLKRLLERRTGDFSRPSS
jgi:hypothetical protein